MKFCGKVQVYKLAWSPVADSVYKGTVVLFSSVTNSQSWGWLLA